MREHLSEYSFVWLIDPAPRQALVPPTWERLHEVTAPTCIIVGADDDFLLHRFADQLQQDIAGSQRITIPATHHMPNMEKPEQFNSAVLAFLDHISTQILP